MATNTRDYFRSTISQSYSGRKVEEIIEDFENENEDPIVFSGKKTIKTKFKKNFDY